MFGLVIVLMIGAPAAFLFSGFVGVSKKRAEAGRGEY